MFRFRDYVRYRFYRLLYKFIVFIIGLAIALLLVYLSNHN